MRGDGREVFEALGRILFEELERLAPSAPDRLNDWEKLGQWERALYVNGVERLFEERELVERALKLADHDPI
jgi:hypothetical protein